LVAALAGIAGAGSAFAENTVINQNMSGFNLPGVVLPQGSDEVRAADGTTCRSAVSGSGAYIDVGVIGNPEQDTVDATFSAYGRLVVPLGRIGPRLDCTALYDLEVQRLAIELKLTQMGLNRGFAPEAEEVPIDGGTKIGDAGDAEEAAPKEKELAKAKTEAEGASTEEAKAAAKEAGERLASIKSEQTSAKSAKKSAAKFDRKTDDWADEGWTTEGRRE
jgi:hypothetical protein